MTAVGGETAVNVVVVEIADGDSRGRGECVPVRRHGETIDSVLAAIQAMKGAVFSGLNRDTLQQAMPPGAARNAIDCAFWAIDANRAYRSVADMAGLGSVKPVVTALTLGFDTPDRMAEVAAVHRTRPLFKLELGGDGDMERVRAVRHAAPAARLIVDANEGWNEGQLSEYMPMLLDSRVELIEQPLPAGADDALVGLGCPIPLCADESCRMVADLDRLVMVGGGSGTSLGVAPALLVAQQAEIVDLDGPLRLAFDRAAGLRYEGGTIYPADPKLWGGPD